MKTRKSLILRHEHGSDFKNWKVYTMDDMELFEIILFPDSRPGNSKYSIFQEGNPVREGRTLDWASWIEVDIKAILANIITVGIGDVDIVFHGF
jgi:hypothetical protein